MLLNHAVPKYYGRFRDAVLRGKIPVNRYVSMQMNRIDSLINDPKYYYDPDAVEKYIKFCEQELTLTDGSDLVLMDTFKLWAEDLLSWFYMEEQSVYDPYRKRIVKKRVKKRLRKKQYLIVGRGAAKTLYLTTIHAYGLVADTETTQQIAVAPTMAQAEETLQPLRTAIARSKGPLFKFLTDGSTNNTNGSLMERKKLASTKKGVQMFLTNSIVETRPMAISKLQGLRSKYNTVDEWLSVDIREDPIGAIEQGASKTPDYIIVAASSEGTARNGVGDSIKMELIDILKGKYEADYVSIWYYRLDDVKEVSNPAVWVKANPNLGISVMYDAYQREVERAENVPAARNDILAKRFGIPMEGFTYFFTYKETLPHRKQDFRGMPCSLGADLSKGDDFCSFTFLFPLDDGFGIRTRNYITELTLNKLNIAARTKYEQFIKEGSLVVMPETVLKMDHVYDDLDQFIEDNDYEVLTFGYDPYNAAEFVDRYRLDNGEMGIEKVIQGTKTESVPLGELKIYAERRKLYFYEEIMVFAMGNCIVLTDNNDNRKLSKKRSDQKIDPVSAMLDAYIAYKRNADLFD